MSELTERLEYLRGEIEAERISYSDLYELRGLGGLGLIPEGDLVLREWAGLPHFIVTLQHRTPDRPYVIFDQEYYVAGDSELEAEAEAFDMAEEDGRGFAVHLRTEEVGDVV